MNCRSVFHARSGLTAGYISLVDDSGRYSNLSSFNVSFLPIK
jgi:hypothetical protein